MGLSEHVLIPRLYRSSQNLLFTFSISPAVKLDNPYTLLSKGIVSPIVSKIVERHLRYIIYRT